MKNRFEIFHNNYVYVTGCVLVCQLVILTVKASDYQIKISIPLFELNIMRFIWQQSGKVC